MKVSELVKTLEDLVSLPVYNVIGCTSKGLALFGLSEGKAGISIMDKEGEVRRVSSYTVAGFARPYPKADKLVYIRDVAKGAEKHEVRVIDVRKEKDEVLIENLKPMRIVGIAQDLHGVAFSGVTEKDISVYYFDGRNLEKVVELPGLGYVTSLDGETIVGEGSLRGDPKSMEIFIVNRRRKELNVFTPKPGSVNKLPFVYKGKVYFETNAYGKNRIAVLDLGSENVEILEGKDDYAEYNPTEHLNIEVIDDKLIIIAKKEGRSRAFIEWKEVPAPQGTVNGITMCDNKIYASITSMRFPSIIVESDIGKDTYKKVYEVQLSDDLKEKLSGEVKFVLIRSKDGTKVPTFVVEKAKKAPTVVYVHGGPWSEVMDEWRIIIASLIAMGFNVIAPNFRGSTGYGEEYRVADIGDPGGKDFEDVVSVAKWALDSGMVTKDKLYIMGYSYGGYMTLWTMVSEPDLFSCGAAGAAVADWEEMYELSDAIFRRFIDILFAGRRDLMKERSPIARAERLKKPLCIVQPQNDTRTPLKPVLRFVNKLQDLGKKFELHVVPDMGHVINNIDDAVKILLPMLLFLKRCIS